MAVYSIDRVVALVIAVTLGVVALVIWRGDQLGLKPVAFDPALDSQEISLRATLRVRFDQPLERTLAQQALSLSPPVSGTLTVSGDELSFAPATSFQPATQYQVTINPVLRSSQGRQLRQPIQWRFRTGALRILYSASDVAGAQQLFTAEVDLPGLMAGAAPLAARQLTTNTTGIWDFAVAPDGHKIIYSVLEKDGAGNLWQTEPSAAAPSLLLACPEAVCSGVAWAPDNRLIAYSKRNVSSFSAGVTSPPRLWLLNTLTGENSPLLADDQKLSFEPRWSADGEWLSYLAPDLGGVGVINLFDGHTQFYESNTGEAGIWQPKTDQLLMNVQRQVGEQTVVHLLLINPVTNEQRLLSGEMQLVEDGSAAWSPDGEWIAFGRKELTGPTATPGRQLWLMRSDGSHAQALTHEPAVDFSQPAWSPDGRFLLLHQLPLKGPQIVLSVWVLEVASGKQWEVARPGQRPFWLP